MKIGIISNLYPPYQRGGAEYVVVRTVESLIDMGHDVFVISGRPRKKQYQVGFDQNTAERIYRFWPMNVYFLLSDNKFPWLARLVWHIIDTFCWCGKRQVGRILDQEEPDVVITHNLKGIGLRIPQAIQKRNIPHVHVAHDLQLLIPSGLVIAGEEQFTRWTRVFYKLYRHACRWAFGSPDLVLFPSHFLLEEYRKKYFFSDAQNMVMQNPAPDFQPVTRTARTPGPLRMLFVGQLEEHKGIGFLLDVFSLLSFPAQLIIAGEGTMREEIKRRAKLDKKVSYLGYVSTTQLLHCLGVADVLVVPSLCYENSPTVIYEALEAGVPVLASDIGGVGELVQDGRNGYLFKPGSKEDAIEKMETMNRNKEAFFKEQKDIQRTVAPYALKMYTSTLVKKLEELIRA